MTILSVFAAGSMWFCSFAMFSLGSLYEFVDAGLFGEYVGVPL